MKDYVMASNISKPFPVALDSAPFIAIALDLELANTRKFVLERWR